MGTGMRMDLKERIEIGHYLTSTRTFSLTSTDTPYSSENVAENTLECSPLDQRQWDHLLKQQQIQDAPQHCLQSGPDPPKQLSSGRQNQEQQLPHGNGVENRGPETNKGGAALDAHGLMTRGLEKNEDVDALDVDEGPKGKEDGTALHPNGVAPRGPEVPPSHSVTGSTKLNPHAKDFVPLLHSDICSTKLNPLAKDSAAPWHSDIGSTKLNSLAKNSVAPSHFDTGSKKLNPLAEDFVVSSHFDTGSPALPVASSSRASTSSRNWAKNPEGLPANNQTSREHCEDSLRRTVYVSDIDQQVTEEQLANLFIATGCGQVVDCRFWGYPNSPFGCQFAFVEFTEEDGALKALNLTGIQLDSHINHVRVLASKSAMVPVNPAFLPRSEDEREMCSRTIYCKNIGKSISEADVKLFFEFLCGEVAQLRLLGDYHHSTRFAFVEFVRGESAMLALSCSGAILGSLPIRVGPSKTPVRRLSSPSRPIS